MMVDKNLMTWMVTELNMSYVPGSLWDSYYTQKKKISNYKPNFKWRLPKSSIYSNIWGYMIRNKN